MTVPAPGHDAAAPESGPSAAPARQGPERRLRGLSGEQVAARVAAGQVNRVGARHSRTVAEILRANVLTRFNALLLHTLRALLERLLPLSPDASR